MLAALSLKDPALQVIAEIVHEIDLRDGLYRRPEVLGVDAILEGWLLADCADAELEARGIALFEGLYNTLKEDTVRPLQPPANPEQYEGESDEVDHP
jgi:hypothetical protein